jgi:ATP-dependent Clp protease ATP-binding subunit ClpC
MMAQDEARLLNHSFIGSEHLLLGLIAEGEGVAAKALEQLDISLEAAEEKVEEMIGISGTAPTGSTPFTPRAKKVLELSYREALQLGTTTSARNTCSSAWCARARTSRVRSW